MSKNHNGEMRLQIIIPYLGYNFSIGHYDKYATITQSEWMSFLTQVITAYEAGYNHVMKFKPANFDLESLRKPYSAMTLQILKRAYEEGGRVAEWDKQSRR